MADTDNIHDDIREIRESLTLLVGSTASNGTKIDALNDRLFGASGSVPALWEQVSLAKEKASTAREYAEKTNAKVERQRAYVAGFSAAGIILGGLAKALLSKIGLHF